MRPPSTSAELYPTTRGRPPSPAPIRSPWFAARTPLRVAFTLPGIAMLPIADRSRSQGSFDFSDQCQQSLRHEPSVRQCSARNLQFVSGEQNQAHPGYPRIGSGMVRSGYLESHTKADAELWPSVFLLHSVASGEWPRLEFCSVGLTTRRRPCSCISRFINAQGQQVAQNPLTGQLLPQGFIGSIVPGSGNPNNGLVSANAPGVPEGFMYNRGVQFGPRFGFAYALTQRRQDRTPRRVWNEL